MWRKESVISLTGTMSESPEVGGQDCGESMKINSNRIAREEILGELYIAFSKEDHRWG